MWGDLGPRDGELTQEEYQDLGNPKKSMEFLTSRKKRIAG